jgi:transposase-like protein
MSILRNTHMMSTAVEVITSVRRRRRWTAAEMERLVAASLEPGAVASAVAREAGIHVSQLFEWQRQLCGSRRHVAAEFALPADAARLRCPFSV